MAAGTTSRTESRGGWNSGRFAHTFAAIDLGTNNCRLLVARATMEGFEVIDAYSRPVRLGGASPSKVARWAVFGGPSLRRHSRGFTLTNRLPFSKKRHGRAAHAPA